MSEFNLIGLDGSNPLGFLAALGTLRTAAIAWSQNRVCLGWTQTLGAWRPALAVDAEISVEKLLTDLHVALYGMNDHPAFAFANDLTMDSHGFREVAVTAQSVASPKDRRFCDFIAAFANETVKADKTDQIVDTALRTMSGAGHQHFLGFIRQLTRDTEQAHIEKALFSPWRYDDPMEKHTMRWDPSDDVRYALQWQNPSGDPSRKAEGSVWGANRLAIEALPMMPTAPAGGELYTTGFQQRGGREFWTWPIWSMPLGLDIVRSLLALRELQDEHPPRDPFQTMGIVEVFRCQRITQGKYRNFTPAVPV